MNRFFFRLALTLGALATAPGVIGAQQGLPPLIPLEHFFDNPELAGGQLSPDGQWLSVLKPWQGKLNIFVRRLGTTHEYQMTADTTRPVTAYFWSQDAKYLLYVQDKGGNENFHVYTVPVSQAGVPAGGAAPDARDLTPFDNVRALIFDVPRDLPGRILVGLNKREPSAFDAYWLDLESGALTLVAENPGRHAAYLLDKQHTVRVAWGQGGAGESEIYVRATEADPWRLAASYPASENVFPARMHPDGRRLYLVSNHGETDFARLVLLDLQTGAETTVEGDPLGQADLGGALFSDVTDELLLTSYVGDTVRLYPKTPQMTRDLARIRRLHAGVPGLRSPTRDETRWIVSFDDPTDPGATYLYDRKKGRGEFLYRPRPWLVPAQLAGMMPVSFQARDGLTIHGYLTTPKGVAARKLPVVLVVHGGPWSRDTWGYDPEAQLLANRGYAVLQVNYRGSTGYGKAFYNAAVKQFARAMHTDLIDGVRWAIAQGIADSTKVAIYGGSYGGYATLVGVTFTPEVFACGLDYVGPSSLITLIESFPPYWRPFLEGTWFRFVGDPAKLEDREDLKQRSPVFFVDRIKAPLLIAQGANDPRVTKRESDQMAMALRDRGIKVRYLVAPNEGHGFANADNRLALYRAMELFFKDCLGGRAQEAASPAIEAQIRKLTVGVDTLRLAAVAPPAAELTAGDAAVNGAAIGASSRTRRMILVQAGQEREVGTLTEGIAVTTVGGQPALQYVQAVQSPMIGAGGDTVVMVRNTLAPLTHRSSNARRTMALDYTGGGTQVTGKVTPAGGAATAVDATLAAPAFDAVTVDLVLSALPLAEGYAVKLPVYLHEAGGLVWVTARVTGSEDVEAGGAKVAAWRVESEIAQQQVTFWIAKEGREVVRSAIQLGPGVELITKP